MASGPQDSLIIIIQTCYNFNESTAFNKHLTDILLLSVLKNNCFHFIFRIIFMGSVSQLRCMLFVYMSMVGISNQAAIYICIWSSLNPWLLFSSHLLLNHWMCIIFKCNVVKTLHYTAVVMHSCKFWLMVTMIILYSKFVLSSHLW